jgi:tRNA wybutosine-synthesizing protein 2
MKARNFSKTFLEISGFILIVRDQPQKPKNEDKTSFYASLCEAMKDTLSEELLEQLPRGFQDLEKNMVLRLKEELHPYETQIAKTIHERYPNMKAIWKRGDIVGKFREPAGLTLLWGENDPIVTVLENGVRYRFDFTKIMFAKGNMHERARIPKLINIGEIVVDMFAGIGYFSLGIGKHSKPAKIYSIELNPVSFEFLQQNIELNKLTSIITPIHGDCMVQVPELAKNGVLADKVIMGIFPEPIEFISSALTVAKPGTIVFYEGIDKADGRLLFENFQKKAAELDRSVELKEVRVVKNYKPHQFHVVDSILITN